MNEPNWKKTIDKFNRRINTNRNEGTRLLTSRPYGTAFGRLLGRNWINYEKVYDARCCFQAAQDDMEHLKW